MSNADEASFSRLKAHHGGFLSVAEGEPKRFKKMLCQIEGTKMKCYEKTANDKAKIVVEVAGCQSAEFAAESKSQPCLKIVGPDPKSKPVYFLGEDPAEIGEWIYVLDRVRKGLSPDPPEPTVVKPNDTIKRAIRPTRRPKPTGA